MTYSRYASLKVIHTRIVHRLLMHAQQHEEHHIVSRGMNVLRGLDLPVARASLDRATRPTEQQTWAEHCMLEATEQGGRIWQKRDAKIRVKTPKIRRGKHTST